MRAGGAAVACALVLAGCATRQLADTTVAQGDTISDIEYRMVLANMAMFRTYRPRTLADSPLPWHLKITQGSAEVADSVSPTVGASLPSAETAPGVTASRGVTVNWTFVPDTENAHLLLLRDLYFAATRDGAFEADFDEGARPGGAPAARYRGLWVWPRPGHIGALTNLALTVLKDAPVEEDERPVLIPGTPK